MRSQHRRRPAAEVSQAPGEGVQSVGVDHQRGLDPAGEAPDKLERSGVPAEPRTEDAGCRALEDPQHRLLGSGDQTAVAPGTGDRHHLRLGDLENDVEVGGHGHRRVAGSGSDRRQRGHLHRPGEPARTTGDPDLTGTELGRPRPSPRQKIEDERLDLARDRLRRRAGRNSDRHLPQLAGMPLSRRDLLPELCGMEADGQVGLDSLPFDLAAGGIHSRGDVAGDHRGTAAVDRLDRRSSRLPRRSVESSPEDRIDHCARPGKSRRHISLHKLPAKPLEIHRRIPPQLLPRPQQQRLDLEPHLPQQPRRHEPVAAVVALPADNPHRPLGRKPSHGLSDGPASSLHQLQRGDALFLDSPPINRADAFGVE